MLMRKILNDRGGCYNKRRSSVFPFALEWTKLGMTNSTADSRPNNKPASTLIGSQ